MVAVFLGWLLANEELNARIGVASAIIIGSVIFINWARQLKTKQQTMQIASQESSD